MAPRGIVVNLTILFDLDGTLTDPEPGITNCIRYALRTLGYPDQSAAALRWCIGPPLHASFAQLLTTTDETLLTQAVGFYRQRYDLQGYIENMPYPGIHTALANLCTAGAMLFLATAKVEYAATAILKHFELDAYFTAVYGSHPTGAFSNKIDLVRHIVQQEGIDPATAWMVGDRVHDMRGGKANGLRTLGVTYGYGSRAELEAAGADALADTVSQLLAILLA
jgi:phosphoglycolate phosphatase